MVTERPFEKRNASFLHYCSNRLFCVIQGLSQDSQKHKHTKDKLEDTGVRLGDLSNKDSNDRLHDDSCSCHDSTESLSDAHDSSNAKKSDTKMLTLPHVTINSNHDNHDPHDHLEYHDHHEVSSYNAFT